MVYLMATIKTLEGIWERWRCDFHVFGYIYTALQVLQTKCTKVGAKDMKATSYTAVIPFVFVVN